MKLLNFNIIKLFLFLVLGILLGLYTSFKLNTALVLTSIQVLFLGVLWFLFRNTIVKSPLFGILVFTTMTSIGCTTYLINQDKNIPNHYTKSITPESTKHLTLKVTERLKPDLYNEKYMASILSLNEKEVSGTLLINIRKDSLSKPLEVDNILYTLAKLRPIQGPLNPHQFNYKTFLERRNVYHQLYLTPKDHVILSRSITTIYGYADTLRKTINSKLKAAGFKPDTLGIINAMLLGQRQDIDSSIYNNYINAGTIHILAVSGLHVGIILFILNGLFKPLMLLRYGYILRPVLIVVLLWLFAIVAGLSPSVTRAVTMFSIISVAMHLKRPTNIYNTLVISAFSILLIKPNFLFEVGFQMSYLAVLGIVSFQPAIYKLWSPKFWIIDKPWQIFTVTLGAQIGVLPISLYYFHQFPGLFFISNLVVIPFLGLILGFGLLVIVLALLGMLVPLIVNIYSTIIESLNDFIGWVAAFENFLLRDIPFDIYEVILSYGIAIATFQFYKLKSAKWLTVGLVFVLGLQVNTIFNAFNTDKQALIIFNKSRHTVIGLRNGSELAVFHDLDTLDIPNENLIRNYKVGEKLTDITQHKLEPVYQLNTTTLLVIDSLGIYNKLSFKPSAVLLRSSPKINLERMIDSLQPQYIIADASNYTTYVNRWKTTCSIKAVNFHYTKDEGAFVLD